MNEGLPARLNDIPASLIDVAETLGPRVAIALIDKFGGLEVKFPHRPRPDHPIIKALGETDGHALCEFLGGQSIYVPHNRAGSRRAEVLALEAAGCDRATIARRLQLSQRHVRRIANGQDDDDQDIDRQGDLFS